MRSRKPQSITLDRQAQIENAVSSCNLTRLGDLLIALSAVDKVSVKDFILTRCKQSADVQSAIFQELFPSTGGGGGGGGGSEDGLISPEARSDEFKDHESSPRPQKGQAIASSARKVHEVLLDNDEDFGLSSSEEAELFNLSQSHDNSNAAVPVRKRQSEDEMSNISKRIRSDPMTNGALEIAQSVLKNRFGMESFRLKQEQAIARLLTGESAVVVFPTGGGKSLCYQLPALCFKELDKVSGIRQGFAESGITLVVSPLIALMKDQVDALKRRGISAAVLDSTKTQEEYRATVESMRNGTLDILYCAPERLNNEGFVGSMANVRGGVRLLAVDEAHCISEWGHAFRPDYLKVARFAKEIEAERVVCLTATATPPVANDVCQAFNVPYEGLFQTSSYRSNLYLQAESYQTKKESYPRLRKFLKAHPGSTIIYVTLQKQSEELATQLRDQGFKTLHYHAGMNKDEKTSCQDRFMASDDLIVVATIAFGMGIDKANIRNVVHYDIPRSLEGYSQEIGRAGRDGLQSHCILYLCAEDLHLRESFARGDLPAKSSVASLLNQVFSTQPTSTAEPVIEASHYNQSRDYDIRATVLGNIYAQLELRFHLLRATTPKYTKYTYTQMSDPSQDRSMAARAILGATKKAKVLWHVDVELAVLQSGLSRSEIVAKLGSWHDEKLIDLQTAGVINVYRIMQDLPSTSAETEDIVDKLYRELELREQQELQRMRQVIDLITGEKCFSKALAQHFGDHLQDGVDECGHCTWCATGKPVEKVIPPRRDWDSKAFFNVLEACPDRDDARYLARVAFGIASPRILKSRLNRSPVFASMEDHSFMSLLQAFEKVCQKDH